MYYSGHGHPDTGAWVVTLWEQSIEFEKAQITLEEVLDIFKESGYKGFVEISSDSCYSGNLCYRAKKYWESNGGHDKLPMDELKISTTTHRTRKALWGQYRTMKDKIFKDGTTDEEFIKIQRQYDGRIGLTDFYSGP